MRLIDWGWALLVVLVWGVNFVVIHVGLVGVPPLLLGALRFLLVVLPAIFFVPRPRIPLRWLLAYGLTISFGQFAFLFTAMHVGMPAGIASLVLQSQVIFTLCFGALLLRERWQRHQPMALGLACLGLPGLGGAGEPAAIGRHDVGWFCADAGGRCLLGAGQYSDAAHQPAGARRSAEPGGVGRPGSAAAFSGLLGLAGGAAEHVAGAG